MAKKQPSHGGARPGAGRKPKSASGARQTVVLSLSPEVREFLDTEIGDRQKSEYVDKTIKATKRFKEVRKEKQ